VYVMLEEVMVVEALVLVVDVLTEVVTVELVLV